MDMWVIYEHPADYPAGYVVRRWRVGVEGPEPYEAATAATADLARDLVPNGLECLSRMSEDDPAILEVWL